MTEASEHDVWMQMALAEAANAAAAGEVPVGAVLVRDGEVIARAHNAPLTTHDPTAHAEIRVLRTAGEALQNYRLPGTTLYVTIEPCAMCVGALVHARVENIVFGAREPKAGALVSRETLGDKHWLNHQPRVVEGVLAEAAAEQMSRFFVARREARRAARRAQRPDQNNA